MWSVTARNFSGSCDDLLILTWADPDNSKADKLFQASLALEWQVLQDPRRTDIAILVGPELVRPTQHSGRQDAAGPSRRRRASRMISRTQTADRA